MVLPPSGIRACSSEVAGAYFWYLELVLPPFQVCSSEIVGAWICSALVGAASLLGPGLQFRRRLFFLQLWLALLPFWVRVCSSESVGPCLYFFGSLSWYCFPFGLSTWDQISPWKNGAPNWPLWKNWPILFWNCVSQKKSCLQKNKRLGPAACQGPSMSPKKLSCFFLQWIFPSVAFCQLSYQTHHHQIVFG